MPNCLASSRAQWVHSSAMARPYLRMAGSRRPWCRTPSYKCRGRRPVHAGSTTSHGSWSMAARTAASRCSRMCSRVGNWRNCSFTATTPLVAPVAADLPRGPPEATGATPPGLHLCQQQPGVSMAGPPCPWSSYFMAIRISLIVAEHWPFTRLLCSPPVHPAFMPGPGPHQLAQGRQAAGNHRLLALPPLETPLHQKGHLDAAEQQRPVPLVDELEHRHLGEAVLVFQRQKDDHAPTAGGRPVGADGYARHLDVEIGRAHV